MIFSIFFYLIYDLIFMNVYIYSYILNSNNNISDFIIIKLVEVYNINVSFKE